MAFRVVLYWEYEYPSCCPLEHWPVVNDRWEELPLTIEELNKIKLLFERIKTLKQQGLTVLGLSPVIFIVEFNLLK
jgi:hypothetical protein